MATASVTPLDIPAAELLRRVRAGEAAVLDELYRAYRVAFGKWSAARYPTLRADEIADAFQDAVVAFYENITSGRLTELMVSPKTYVFTLGERFCQKSEKKSTRTINNLTPLGIKGTNELDMLTAEPLAPYALTLADDPFGLAESAAAGVEATNFATIERAMHGLRPECHRLLTAVYYDGLAQDELLETFGYRAPSVLATRKSQCLARLRALCGIERT